MRLQDIYRMALARGLTAKQAGAEYQCSHSSLAKCKGRYGFPSLVSEYECQAREAIAKMNDEELLSYFKVLIKTGKSGSKEYQYTIDESKTRSSGIFIQGHQHEYLNSNKMQAWLDRKDPLVDEAKNSAKLSKNK